MDYIRQRGMDKDGVHKYAYDVQHENGSVKRQVSVENDIHAHGQARQDRDYHGLQ